MGDGEAGAWEQGWGWGGGGAAEESGMGHKGQIRALEAVSRRLGWSLGATGSQQGFQCG